MTTLSPVMDVPIGVRQTTMPNSSPGKTVESSG